MLLAANPTRFMDHYQQQHQSSSRYKSIQQPEHQHHRTGVPGLARQEDSPDFIAAARHDHVNGTAAVAPLPSPQGLLGLADLPPSNAAAAAAAAAAVGPSHLSAHGSSRHPRDATAPGGIISNRAGAGHGFPTDAERTGGGGSGNSGSNRGLLHHASHHYHYHQHQHHFNAALNGRQRGMGGSGGGGGHGEDDFEFLRCILLDAGDGTAHAAHSTALRPPGSAGYLPVSTLAHAAVAATAVSNANEMGFAPISAARATSFAPVSSALQALHTTFPQSNTLVSGVRSYPPQAAFGGGREGGAATSPRDTHAGRTGSPAFGRSGGAEGSAAGGHVTEEERLEAADDVARCIWLAGDELRDVLLGRVWGIWSTVEAEIAEESNSKAAGDRSSSSSSSPRSSPPARKRFNQVLVERLRATCEAVEAELKAAKANGDASALCAPPPPQWRGGAALRRDVLARLDAYQRNNQDRCGLPGSGHGRFSSMNCLDGLERQQQQQQPGSRLVAANSAAGMASGSDLKQGLETALKTTRGGVKSELLMFGEDEADRGCNVTPPGAGAGAGDRRGAAAVAGDLSAPAGGKRKKRGTGGGAAATDGSGRKRKRSGNGRRCKHEGCLLHPHFGLTRPEYCSKHKLPGMFNVKGRRCVHPECTRTPVYGKSGDPHPTYCAAHKLAGYVDIKNPTCREPTCFRQPSFGSASDRKATYCASHMLTGMVNVRRMLASFKSASMSAAAASATATGSAAGAGAGAGAAPSAAPGGGAGGGPASGGRRR